MTFRRALPAILLQLCHAHRRDFRCRSWNETMAHEHELGFLGCIVPSHADDKYMQEKLLLDGSQPLTSVAQSLMRDMPLQFCECTRHLHNAASCGHSSAVKVLGEYEPWCFMLAVCRPMAQALLHSSLVCHQAGMSGDNVTALCEARGENGCADATSELFEATHTSRGWLNITELLDDLHVPDTSRARTAFLEQLEQHSLELEAEIDALPHASASRMAVEGPEAEQQEGVGTGHPLRRTSSFHFPSWMQSQRPEQVFGQLSGCMASVSVSEAQLNLPVSLSALSGNGSFHSYFDLFRDKCGFDYYEWALEKAKRLSGITYAEDQWEQGNHLTALVVVSMNALLLCCVLFAAMRCVRRGYCYRMCSPSSHEERAGLKDDDESVAAPPGKGEPPPRAP